MIEQRQPEWLDLKALQEYACLSNRTLREWIHRCVDPLPAVRAWGAGYWFAAASSTAGWKLTR